MTKFEAKICVFLKVDFAFVGVVLHDTMKNNTWLITRKKDPWQVNHIGEEKRVMVKRILGGILFICIGFLMIKPMYTIFVDDPKAKKLLSEAVYVTTDTVDPANDGKAVIVSAPFKLVEPAYDDEMGLTLDSIRISRKKERTEYERKTK